MDASEQKPRIRLNSSNATEVIARKSTPVVLPNHPEIEVLVRQLPLNVLRRLSNESRSKNETEAEAAELELIRLSFVNDDGSEVWTTETVKDLKESSAPIYNDLVIVMGRANNKKSKEIEKAIEDAEKN